MLANTFLHIPGVGKRTERRLWSEGCACWDDLLAEPRRWSLGSSGHRAACNHLEKSKQALAEKNHQFFRAGLGAAQAWRAFPEFRDSCLYLDIETDGSNHPESITAIGLYDGKEYRCLLRGEDLENFRDIVSHAGMLITFFGTGFDLPVLARRFPGLRFDQIHVDLCPVLRQAGYRGGLKKIEKEFGIERGPLTAGLNGYDAVVLWRRYERQHDSAALDRFLAYNRDDVVNLEALAERAYDALRQQTLEGEPN